MELLKKWIIYVDHIRGLKYVQKIKILEIYHYKKKNTKTINKNITDLVVGSSSARMPQLRQKVSASASLRRKIEVAPYRKRKMEKEM